MKEAIIATLLLVACTDETATRNTLRNYGFTNIQTTGYEFWGCSDDDQFATGFTAINAQGRRVSGVVCCGWLKNCTVRF